MKSIHHLFVCFHACLKLFTLCIEFFDLVCELVGCLLVINGDFQILAGLA
jgi:hypothetical protein